MQGRSWGFIGCGNLSQSIILGLIKKKVLKSRKIFITNRSQKKLLEFAKQTGCRALKDNKSLVIKAHVIVLGTKPQDLLPVLREIAWSVDKSHTVISLAAGVSADFLKKELPKAGVIIRVMPNLGASVQKGLFGLSLVKGAKSDLKEMGLLFSNIGDVVTVNGDRGIDALTAGSASGMGFVFFLMETFADWFVEKGFSREAARQIAVATFSGSSVLASSCPDESLNALREAVTSKKGTTFAGLKAMQRAGVSRSLKTGLQAACARAEQISKSLRQNRK